MNYLAHLLLSGDSEGLIVGNFIADAVKGSQIVTYSHEIKKGILLHRAIDSFTDNHHVVEQSKSRLRSKYKKYSSIVVDIFYDHFLAINWGEYASKGLSEYTTSVYKILGGNQSIFPEKAKLFYGYMVKYNILNAYSTIQGIEKVMRGMSTRAAFQSNMEEATNDLTDFYNQFQEEFKQFFPLLVIYVESEITRYSKI